MRFEIQELLSRRAIFAVASFALLAFCSFLLMDIARFSWWCRVYAIQSAQGPSQIVPLIDREAIVVLTGDHSRIPRALLLLRTRGSQLLIISGTKKGVTLTDLVNTQGDSTLNIHEIWQKIVVESQSSSTKENAEESQKILLQHGIKRVILVTSDYHMLRSLHIFRHTAPGFDYLEFPVASEISEMSFRFSERNFSAISKVWLEYWKYFFYRATAPFLPTSTH